MALYAENVDDDKRPALYRLAFQAENGVEYMDIYHNKTKLDAAVRELLKGSKQRGCKWAIARVVPLFRDKNSGMCLPTRFEPETVSSYGLKK